MDLVLSYANTGNFGFMSLDYGSTSNQPQSTPKDIEFNFDLLGLETTAIVSEPPSKTQHPQNTYFGDGFSFDFSLFQSSTYTNPNKIMAYENEHIQIWMDCIK